MMAQILVTVDTFRDITDAKYKLFTNLLTEPTTTVDTTDPSFEYTDLILANSQCHRQCNRHLLCWQRCSTHRYFNHLLAIIFNANTEVTIAAVNANVNMVVNSVHKLPMYGQAVSVWLVQ
jgi:hypothetical protein